MAGLFDPLTPVQARRIEDGKRGQMLVVVLENEEALLPADARCCLLAALRSVDFVAQGAAHQWHSILPQNDSVCVIEDWQAERRRSEEFVQRILARQGGAAS